MAYQKSTAVCIGISDYSESSQIVSFFTRDFGILKLIHKGALRKGRVFAAPVDLLSYYQIVFSLQKKGLHILTEVALLENFHCLSANLQKYYAALSMLEIVQTQREELPDTTFFDAFLFSLQNLVNARYVYSLSFNFIQKSFSILGYEPSLDNCSVCGAELSSVQSNRNNAVKTANVVKTAKDIKISLSLREGGLLCNECAGKIKTDMYISHAALRALRNLYLIPTERSGLVFLPDNLRKEIATFINKFLEFTFEKEFKMVKLFAEEKIKRKG
ncbi:MAG: DNA repair protein RecO [Planctomycetota bacterium]